MTAPLTRMETSLPTRSDPQQIFAAAAARETGLSRLLVFYVTTALVFMSIPGTFLGVWR